MGVAIAGILTPQPQVWVDSTPLAKTKADSALRQVTVVSELDLPSMFTLELVNRALMPGEVRWVDEALFDIGTQIKIQMGSGDLLIDGEITGLEPEFTANAIPTLIVRGYDRRHRLMRGQKTRSFVQMKDSEIASQIARAAGLQVPDFNTQTQYDSKIKLDYVLQHNQSDLEFLQARASRIGYELVITGKTLSFRPQPQNGLSQLTLRFPDDITRFSPRLSSLNQVEQVEVRGWDMVQKKPVVARSRTNDQPSGMGQERGSKEAWQAFGQTSQIQAEQPVMHSGEAARMAQGQFQQMALGYITGDGEGRGSPGLQAGRFVDLQGLGKRFGGVYYVTAATHSFGPNQPYRTEFSVKRNAHTGQERSL